MSKKKMPTPNSALKDFFSDNEMVADVFNTYMFGEVVLKPEDLQSMDTACSDTVEQTILYMSLMWGMMISSLKQKHCGNGHAF